MWGSCDSFLTAIIKANKPLSNTVFDFVFEIFELEFCIYFEFRASDFKFAVPVQIPKNLNLSGSGLSGSGGMDHEESKAISNGRL